MVKQIGRWHLKHTLGHGSFGEVKLAQAADGQQAACKVCQKVKLCEGPGRAMLQREIATQKALRHPNVLQLLDVLETAKHFYMIIELATGGELLDLIQNHKRFDEATARRYFHQLILGVRYCHEQGIVHRDLKPQNLLLTHESNLKLADFGFSNFQEVSDVDGKVTRTLRLQTCCGTPNYAAPEIFLGKGYSGFCTDVWSCGVILYVMMVGHVPFRSDGQVKGLQGVIIAICEGRYSIPSQLPAGARDLIKRILVNEPDQRYKVADIIAHQWFAEGFDYSQVLDKVAKMDLSEDMIRMSIKPAEEQEYEDDAGGAGAEPTWGPSDDQMPSVLDALDEADGDERYGDEDPGEGADLSRELSTDVMEQCAKVTGSFDDHGCTKPQLEQSPQRKARGGYAGGAGQQPRGAAGRTVQFGQTEQLANSFSAVEPGAEGDGEEKRTAHVFSKALLPTLCFYCGKFIYGSGMQCQKCKMPVHQKCSASAGQYTCCEQYVKRATAK